MGAMSDENLYFLIELLQNYLLFHLLQSRIVRIPADDRKTNILGQLQEVLARNCLSKQENIWSICYLSDRFVKTTRVNDTKSYFSTLKIKAKKRSKISTFGLSPGFGLNYYVYANIGSIGLFLHIYYAAIYI